MISQSQISVLNEAVIDAVRNPEKIGESMSVIQNIYDFVDCHRKPDPNYVPFKLEATNKGDLNTFLDRTYQQSTIMLVVGRRGSGKTALGMRLLEAFHKKINNRGLYAVGYNSAKLPLWIHKIDSVLDAPSNSVVLVDEGAVVLSSRDSHNGTNKAVGKLMAVARHKNLSLILITQNSAMIDVNVLRLADTLIVKQPSLMQTRFERKEMKALYDQTTPYFVDLKGIEQKQALYVIDDEFEGFLKAGLPDFWTEKISKSFEDL